MANYGVYNYESGESRALKSITADSYNKDQAKNLIQLNNNSEYMAQYLRKLQKGVDEANQNVIEQIQGLITDILVLIGGQGDTLLEFGDLKYVFQAIGALFGFDGGIVPVNLFEAAWHFFSTYILPINSFGEVIWSLIDEAIAFILDIFGEIPIVGEALQQLAVFISDIRDGLGSLFEFVDKIFDAIGNVFEMLFGWFDLEALLTGAWNFVEGIADFIGNLISKGLLAIFSPLDAGKLFGTPKPSLFDSIPLGSIGDFEANFLANPIFDSEESLAGNNEFVWDAAQSYNNTGGSAKVVADGNLHDLYANPVSVTTGQKIQLRAYTKWSLTSGNPNGIKLDVTGFDGEGQEIDTFYQTVDFAETSALSSDWVELTGELVIPEGIEKISLALVVDSTVTAGDIWFSNAGFTKPKNAGVAPLDWVIDLPELFEGIDEFVQGVLDAVIEVVTGIFTFGGTLDDFFENLWDWFEDTLATAAQAADALLNALGINRILTKWFGLAESPVLADAEEAVIALNGRITALEGAGTITTYTVSGTWTNPSPSDHVRIKVIVYCGGDSGARPTLNYKDQPKGGFSGGYVEKELWTDELPSTVAMTIGAGGAGVTSGGSDGNPGAISSFGTYVVGQKGVGAIYRDGAKLPERGVPPGDGGNGAWLLTDNDNYALIASTSGGGGAFAKGGRAGFGSSGSAIDGKHGDAAPANQPSGGGGGGGGSVAASVGEAGNGGNGGFPGGGGGAPGMRGGGTTANSGSGAQGAIQIVTGI